MPEETGGIRVNKYLSEAGVCSRREADRLIEAGRVEIDGVVCTPGMKVCAGAKVTVDGREIGTKQDTIVIAVNKPTGIVCTTSDPHAEQNIVDFIGFDKRIFPVGRLDKESEGLILMTNDGELSDRILRSRNEHEKEYIVKVNKPITSAFAEGMRKGVFLEELNVRTKPCKVKVIDKFTFSIVLTQGLNRQIRRMCRAFDYHVRELKRIRIMDIKLGELETGKWRYLSREEIEGLRGR